MEKWEAEGNKEGWSAVHEGGHSYCPNVTNDEAHYSHYWPFHEWVQQHNCNLPVEVLGNPVDCMVGLGVAQHWELES